MIAVHTLFYKSNSPPGIIISIDIKEHPVMQMAGEDTSHGGRCGELIATHMLYYKNNSPPETAPAGEDTISVLIANNYLCTSVKRPQVR